MDLSLTDEQQAFVAEARAWLEAHYDPPGEFTSMDEEVAWGRRWQAELARGGWVGLHWPPEYGGRGASPVEVALFNMEYARSRAPQPVNRVGLNLAGPTVLAHGTEAQKERLLPPLLTAEEIWCQLFSEPDAGSDLASLSTRAERVHDGWVLTGQKVWTSYAQYARWGLCLARTNVDATKHRGISALIVDMDADGIEIRPLVQPTGDAEFSEVFLDGVHVPEDRLVGEVDEGWGVASTTLAHERGVNFPFKEQVVHEVYLGDLVRRAVEEGRFEGLAAEELARAYVNLRLLALANLRTMSRLSNGATPGPETSVVKLQWTQMTQHLSRTAFDLFGTDPRWQRQYLWSRVASIAGGTSEIQRTIVGERILGLPRTR